MLEVNRLLGWDRLTNRFLAFDRDYPLLDGWGHFRYCVSRLPSYGHQECMRPAEKNPYTLFGSKLVLNCCGSSIFEVPLVLKSREIPTRWKWEPLSSVPSELSPSRKIALESEPRSYRAVLGVVRLCYMDGPEFGKMFFETPVRRYEFTDLHRVSKFLFLCWRIIEFLKDIAEGGMENAPVGIVEAAFRGLLAGVELNSRVLMPEPLTGECHRRLECRKLPSFQMEMK